MCFPLVSMWLGRLHPRESDHSGRWSDHRHWAVVNPDTSHVQADLLIRCWPLGRDGALYAVHLVVRNNTRGRGVLVWEGSLNVPASSPAMDRVVAEIDVRLPVKAVVEVRHLRGLVEAFISPGHRTKALRDHVVDITTVQLMRLHCAYNTRAIMRRQHT